jgi:rhodanese-related sulfurtransferase
MKKLVITLALALAPLLALADPTSTPAPAGAPATPSAKPTAVAPTLKTAPAVMPTPAPTAKPLYVDYVPPDWAKAKEHITLAQAKKWVKDKGVLFCDARAKVEYDQGHIPGAIPLPTGEFEKYYLQHLNRIKKARKLVTYCHGVGCRLSEKSANSLVDKGFKNVAVFFGGWPQWSQASLPIETGDTFASDVAPAATPNPTSTPAPAPAPAAAAAGAGATPTAAAVGVSPAAK